MKTYQKTTRLIIFTGLLFFSGCKIFSLYPLYHEEDLIVKTELIGIWQMDSSENNYIRIDTLQDELYTFSILDSKDTVNYAMGLLELNNQYFIDLWALEVGNYEMWELMGRNFIPVHTFMKFDFIDNEITITPFDIKRLIKLFKENKIRLAHEFPWGKEDDDYVVITASTSDLQKFIARYANDKDAFEVADIYHRVKP